MNTKKYSTFQLRRHRKRKLPILKLKTYIGRMVEWGTPGSPIEL